MSLTSDVSLLLCMFELTYIFAISYYFCSILYVFIFIIFYNGSSSGGDKCHTLERKLYYLQEELTELHRKRGEVCLLCKLQVCFIYVLLLLIQTIMQNPPHQ